MLQARFRLGHELLFLRIFHISEKEYEILALPCLKLDFDIVRGDRTPSVSNTVSSHSGHDILRITELIVKTDERLPVGIETVNRGIHAVERIVIAALLIFRLVIYRRTVDLNLSGREVALEILHVRSRIPEAPFSE